MWLFGFLFLLSCLSRSDAIWGSKEVSGYVGKSLTMTCNYEARFEKERKWWCQGAAWNPCKILVETTGRKEVKKDRVTLRDDQREHRLTMTIERLRLDDTDKYWCKISRLGTVQGVSIKVVVSPEPTTTTTTKTTMTTMTTTMSMMTTITMRALTTPAPPEETTYSPSVRGLPSNTIDSSIPMFHHFIPVMLLLPLFLISLLVWKKLKQQRTAARISSKLDAEEQKEVYYAHLSLRSYGPALIYDNTAPPKSCSASRSLEVATEYSSIGRPKAGL